MNKIKNTRNIGNKSYLFCRIPGHRQSPADTHSPATLPSQKASGSSANTNKSLIPLAGRNLHLPWTSPPRHHLCSVALGRPGRRSQAHISVIFICLGTQRLKKRILPFSMDFPHDLGLVAYSIPCSQVFLTCK